MGIEKFFNSIKKSYGNKIISKIDINTYYSCKFFLLDFNSIIHNISQSISTSLCYLYHISLVSNIKTDIYQSNQKQIKLNLDNLITDFILDVNTYIPDQSQTDGSQSFYNNQIDFNNLSIDNLDRSFFNIMMTDDNLDKLIIHHVSSYVKSLTKYMPNLQLLYMAIDGVPLFTKMIEQKKRRYISYIIDETKIKVLELYKSELDIDPNINNNEDIYYNHYEFENKIRRLKFNKNKISPATQFMSNLETYIDNYLKSRLDSKIKIIIDSYTNMGEGEKKIVYKIHELSTTKQLLDTDLITIYSPDADVILLMLMELDKAQIQIMRYDQQQNQLDLININELQKIIFQYMQYHNKSKIVQQRIISDIVMLFTILGNDFLPRIEIIETNKHIKNILDSYLKLNISDRFIFGSNIDWVLLKDFFINLNKSIENNQTEFHRRKKDWSLLPDQILNHNAIPYYTHIFNIDNLTNTYEPPTQTNININKYSNKLSERITRKYLQGFIWLEKYYLEHNFNYKLFYYKYDTAPTIKQLIITINKIIQNQNQNMILDKILSNLEKTIPNKYFTPQTQLIYISPTDVSDIIDKKFLTSKFSTIIKSYNEKFNQEPNLNITNNRINLFEYLDCSNAIFLSKCHITKINRISPNKILNYLYND